MTITDEQRDLAFETATEAQQKLYASPEGGKKLREMAEKYAINNAEQYRKFAITAGDLILELLDKEQLQQNLVSEVGLDATTAGVVTNELIALVNANPTRESSAVPVPPPPAPSGVEGVFLQSTSQDDLLNEKTSWG